MLNYQPTLVELSLVRWICVNDHHYVHKEDLAPSCLLVSKKCHHSMTKGQLG